MGATWSSTQPGRLSWWQLCSHGWHRSLLSTSDAATDDQVDIVITLSFQWHADWFIGSQGTEGHHWITGLSFITFSTNQQPTNPSISVHDLHHLVFITTQNAIRTWEITSAIFEQCLSVNQWKGIWNHQQAKKLLNNPAYFVVITVPADGLAPMSGARTSAVTMETKFPSFISQQTINFIYSNIWFPCVVFSTSGWFFGTFSLWC